jgi:hypothetical protein
MNYDNNRKLISKSENQVVNGIPLSHPNSSEMDKQGNIYITDQNNKRAF